VFRPKGDVRLKINILSLGLVALLGTFPTTIASPAAPVEDPDFVLRPVPGVQGGTHPTAGEFGRLIGTVYEGPLPIDGWDDFGGGLLAEPVWFNQYQRTDGALLVLSLLTLPRRPGSQQATFKVADVLFVTPLESGLELSFFCRSQGYPDQKFIAVVRSERSEFWRDIRQAWRVEMSLGRIAPITPTGIECVNEGWGE